MRRTYSVLVIAAFTLSAFAQSAAKKYPWQHGDTQCNKMMTFCWYGKELVSDPQVTAYGNRWVAQDKDEKPFEWITQVRCLKDLGICILARNQKVMNGSQTNTDIYRVESWTSNEIRAVVENDFPKGKECEIDTLLLNRAEGSVSMLSTPGPAATTKICAGPFGDIRPKTVIYKLEIGPPNF
ncbi:MAG TPA: hypothetical protein VFI45_19855 [Candidatus Acidoferrum sp.]|nr:hypothetical protein [Candidatus Acidoferrum sp.]